MTRRPPTRLLPGTDGVTSQARSASEGRIHPRLRFGLVRKCFSAFPPLALSVAALTALLGCHGETPPTSHPEEPVRIGPRLVASETRRDAGEVDFAQERAYAFPIGNDGDEPLLLSVVRRSCRCAGVDVPEGVAPGQQAAVTIRWAPPAGSAGPVTLTVGLETNDPRAPSLDLEVKGQCNPVIRLAPENRSYVDFEQVQPGKPAERQLKVFSTKLPRFGLKAAASHPGLSVAVTPLEPEAVVEGLKLRSGYALAVRTTPQLPGGYFSESVLLTLEPPDEPARTVRLPVYGEVRSGVFSLGPHEVEFQKPKATDPDTKTVRVRFLEQADDEAVEVVQHEPAFLVVDPPQNRQPGQWEFKVSIPANNADAARFQPDRFFEGRVVLRLTTGGNTSEAQVRVKWKPTGR